MSQGTHHLGGLPDGCDPGSEEESGTDLVAEGMSGPFQGRVCPVGAGGLSTWGVLSLLPAILRVLLQQNQPRAWRQPAWGSFRGCRGGWGFFPPQLRWPPARSCLPFDAEQGAGWGLEAPEPLLLLSPELGGCSPPGLSGLRAPCVISQGRPRRSEEGQLDLNFETPSSFLLMLQAPYRGSSLGTFSGDFDPDRVTWGGGGAAGADSGEAESLGRVAMAGAWGVLPTRWEPSISLLVLKSAGGVSAVGITDPVPSWQTRPCGRAARPACSP